MRRSWTWLTLAVALSAAVSSLAAVNSPVAGTADGPNLLQNPGFEGPFFKQCCQTDLSRYHPNTPIDEVQVAAGWHAWWLEPDRDAAHPGSCQGRPQPCTPFHRPEWREANCGPGCANRIHGGSNAQKYFTFFSVHDAGLYQQVAGIVPGQRLRFSVYMQAWSTGADYGPSAGQQSMGMRVGIDPTGGVDPFSPNVVWSAPQDFYDVWGLYTVEAIAQSRTVTVYTRSTPHYALQHNDIYVDDASLVVVGSGSAAEGGAVPANITPASGAVYVVCSGDTLWRIARRNGVSLAEIMRANGLTNADRIYVGQKLIIPGRAEAVAAATTSWGAPPAGGGLMYVVQRGDTLTRIARRYGTTVARLKELNHLRSDVILIGQTLIVGP